MNVLLLVCVLVLAQPGRTPRPDRPEPFTPRDRAPQELDKLATHTLVLGTSDDGLVFEERAEAVMTGASSPDIIQLARDLPGGEGAAKGHWCIYAADGRGSGAGSVIKLTSTDGGKSWSQPQRVEFLGGQMERIAEPCIVQLDDGRLRMYVRAASSGRPGPLKPKDVPPGLPPPVRAPEPPKSPTAPSSPGGPGRIDPSIPRPVVQESAVYSAISRDGVTFEFEPGARVEGREFHSPDVVRTGGEWLMFLSRGDDVRVARSADGLSFSVDGAPAFRHAGATGAVVMPDGRVRLYAAGSEGLTSLVFDPKSGRGTPDEGVRMKAPCAEPSIWPKSDGGFVCIIRRWPGDQARPPAKYGS